MHDAWTAFYAVANWEPDAASLLQKFGFADFGIAGLIGASDGGGALGVIDARELAGSHGLARPDDPGAVSASCALWDG